MNIVKYGLLFLYFADLWILETSFSMLGKMSISGSFALIYVFSAELFPTVVRTIGVGAGSMSARIGSLVAPFIGELVCPNFIGCENGLNTGLFIVEYFTYYSSLI